MVGARGRGSRSLPIQRTRMTASWLKEPVAALGARVGAGERDRRALRKGGWPGRFLSAKSRLRHLRRRSSSPLSLVSPPAARPSASRSPRRRIARDGYGQGPAGCRPQSAGRSELGIVRIESHEVFRALADISKPNAYVWVRSNPHPCTSGLVVVAGLCGPVRQGFSVGSSALEPSTDQGGAWPNGRAVFYRSGPAYSVSRQAAQARGPCSRPAMADSPPLPPTPSPRPIFAAVCRAAEQLGSGAVHRTPSWRRARRSIAWRRRRTTFKCELSCKSAAPSGFRGASRRRPPACRPTSGSAGVSSRTARATTPGRARARGGGCAAFPAPHRHAAQRHRRVKQRATREYEGTHRGVRADPSGPRGRGGVTAVVAETGGTLIAPFDHPDVIAVAGAPAALRAARARIAGARQADRHTRGQAGASPRELHVPRGGRGVALTARPRVRRRTEGRSRLWPLEAAGRRLPARPIRARWRTGCARASAI